MNNKLFYATLTTILILTPFLIVYATSYNKTVYNNITISSIVSDSIMSVVSLDISIISSVAESITDVITRNIVLSALVFNLEDLEANYTFTSNPDGYEIIYFNETLIETPQTYELEAGSNYNITALNTYEYVLGESRYIFNNWSDGGAISHNVTLPVGDYNYTAYYDIQHKLYVTNGNSTGWYYENEEFISSAYYVTNLISGQSRNNLISYTFNGNTTLVSRSNTGNYTVNDVITEYSELTFNYITQYYITNTSQVSDLLVTVDGSQTSDNWFDSSSFAIIETETPQEDEGIIYTFLNWVYSIGGGTLTNSTTNPYNYTVSNYATFKAYWNITGGGGGTEYIFMSQPITPNYGLLIAVFIILIIAFLSILYYTQVVD